MPLPEDPIKAEEASAGKLSEAAKNSDDAPSIRISDPLSENRFCKRVQGLADNEEGTFFAAWE